MPPIAGARSEIEKGSIDPSLAWAEGCSAELSTVPAHMTQLAQSYPRTDPRRRFFRGASAALQIGEQFVDDTARIRKRNQVATWQHVGGCLQSVLDDTPRKSSGKNRSLKIAWIGTSGHASKRQGSGKHDVGLGSLVRRPLRNNLGRNIV